jgi:hypothetical protein
VVGGVTGQKIHEVQLGWGGSEGRGTRGTSELQLYFVNLLSRYPSYHQPPAAPEKNWGASGSVVPLPSDPPHPSYLQPTPLRPSSAQLYRPRLLIWGASGSVVPLRSDPPHPSHLQSTPLRPSPAQL